MSPFITKLLSIGTVAIMVAAGATAAAQTSDESGAAPEERAEAEVVSLDAFRKK